MKTMKNGVLPPPGELVRLLRFLETAQGRVEHSTTQDDRVRLRLGRRSYHLSGASVGIAIKSGLVRIVDGYLELTSDGLARLRRLQFPDLPYFAQHAELRIVSKPGSRGGDPVIINDAESPLRRLHQRKGCKGNSWLSDSQYEAGERLRRDFERARLQPGVTTNWQALPSGGTKSGYNANRDLCDFAADSRKRVASAMNSLQADLADGALDVCCFLKGLEQVERERQWPPRSAKLMLRTALSCLASHYGLTDKAGNHGARIVRSDDGSARPSLR